jgi:hypothetical protein
MDTKEKNGKGTGKRKKGKEKETTKRIIRRHGRKGEEEDA